MVSTYALVLAAALAADQDLVLLDFGADWCGPCRSMEPTLERLEQAGYPVRRVNIDQYPDLAQRFGIGPIPCFVLMRNGQEIGRQVGATSYDRLVQMFQQVQGSSPLAASGLPPGRSESLPTGSVDSQMRGQSPELPSPIAPRGAQAYSSCGDSAAGRDTRALPGSPPDLPGPGATDPTTAVSPYQLTPAQRLALQATVRLRVTDLAGVSKGTGTIVDVHGDEALVVTCGHIFRDSQGQGTIEVDLFAPGANRSAPGHLLIYECDQRDFALLSVRTPVPVTPVRVARTSYHPRPGEPIFSVGCDRGADPTVRVSSISAIDRYIGHPNIEILGHPVDGRSGGGLFTSDGQIIGVCNAADVQEDRGIFASLPTIHLALDRIGQRRVYQQDGPPGTLLAAEDTPPAAGWPAAAADRLQLANNTVGGQISPTNQPAPGPTPPATAANSAPGAPAPANEVICLVRDPQGETRVVLVKSPSPMLLQQIACESQQPALPASPATPPAYRPEDLARLMQLPSGQPIMRGQNN